MNIVASHSLSLQKDRSSATVIQCLESLFHIFGPPKSLHSDRGPEFFSLEMSYFLSSWGIHQSRTSSYNLTGNSQCEWFNGIIWRTLSCILHQIQLDISTWPRFLGKALHCICSLHCSSTGTTPHAHLFDFNRHLLPVPCHSIIPAENYAWLCHFICHKNDSSGELVKIAAAYPGYAVVALDGQSTTDTINWKHLAPHPGPAPQT